MHWNYRVHIPGSNGVLKSSLVKFCELLRLLHRIGTTVYEGGGGDKEGGIPPLEKNPLCCKITPSPPQKKNCTSGFWELRTL